MGTLITTLSFFICAVSTHFVGVEDFQMSTATCAYSAADRSFVVDLEVYTNNLTELIKTNVGLELDLEKNKDQKAAEVFVEEYLSLNFLLVQEGKQLRQNFLKLEIIDEKTHLIFEVEVLTTNDVMLKNTLFYEIYPAQVNVVKVNSGANSADYYFNSKNPEQAIAL